MCFCVRVPTFCLHVRILLCGWACVKEDAICVWEKVNSEGTLRLHSHSWPGTFSKKIHSTLGLIFPHVWETDLDLIWPLCEKTLCAVKSCLLLQHSPFHREHESFAGFKQLAESWEHKTAHSTVSLQQVRVKNIRPEGCQRESLN